jgi:hypothetical protein
VAAAIRNLRGESVEGSRDERPGESGESDESDIPYSTRCPAQVAQTWILRLTPMELRLTPSV